MGHPVLARNYETNTISTEGKDTSVIISEKIYLKCTIDRVLYSKLRWLHLHIPTWVFDKLNHLPTQII